MYDEQRLSLNNRVIITVHTRRWNLYNRGARRLPRDHSRPDVLRGRAVVFPVLLAVTTFFLEQGPKFIVNSRCRPIVAIGAEKFDFFHDRAAGFLFLTIFAIGDDVRRSKA